MPHFEKWLYSTFFVPGFSSSALDWRLSGEFGLRIGREIEKKRRPVSPHAAMPHQINSFHLVQLS